MIDSKNQIIIALNEVGKNLKVMAENKPYEACNKLIDIEFWEKFNRAILYEINYNGWFVEKNIRQRLKEISLMLDEKKLVQWSEPYNFLEQPKDVGIIMAGNIPLVGFHDFLSVLMTGNKAVVKMSSDDQRLLPLLVDLIAYFYPEINNRVTFEPNFKEIDAMLATGSDNSARYFEKYFGHLPCLIRNNRSSVAVLKGEETEEQLTNLAKDVFDYFGMGCRNVSQIFVPQDYDLDNLFNAFYDYKWVIDHKKYANNYDYYKAIYLMNKVKLLENGFLLTKESDDLFAPVSVLNLKKYKNLNEVDTYLEANNSKIQAVVSDNDVPFGKAQRPNLDDYADGENIMEFLSGLRC